MSLLDHRHVESLETLAGSRNHGDKGKSAVRREDLTGLAMFSHRLQSEAVSAAPTAAQHNALVKDVHAIGKMLNTIAASLENKMK